MYAAQHQFGREDIRHGSIGKLDVNLCVVLDIVVAGPQKSLIPITRQPGNVMGSVR